MTDFEVRQSPADLYALRGPDPQIEAIATCWDAIYATAPTPRQRELWSKLSPMRWPTKRRRRVAACVGRRGWKTSKLLAWTLLYELLCVDHSKYAAAGSRIYFVLIAPLLPQAREAVRAIRAALDELAPAGVRYETRDLAGNAEIVITQPVARCERVISIMAADAVTVRSRAVAFVGYDEASFLASDEWLSEVDRDLVTAVSAGMVQFPDAREVFVSSPGAPQGVFFSLVEKPPGDTLVIRAPSWVVNPNITQADCWRVSGGDAAVFAQEHEASRFGFHNSTFLGASDLRACIDAKRGGQGPRAGHFALGLDIGQKTDASAIVVCSGFLIATKPGAQSLRGVAVDYVEAIEPSKRSPPSIEEIVGRAVTVAKQYGNAPIICDAFNGVSVEEELVDAGWRKVDHIEKLRPKKFFVAGMSPAAQGPRWADVRRHVLGRRVAFHPAHDRLMRELAQLKATQLGSGGMRVEGRRDDVADAFCLAMSVAALLPTTGEGSWQFVCDGHKFIHGQGVVAMNPRWESVVDGRRVVTRVPPEHSKDYDDYAREMIGQGATSEALERWKARQGDKPTTPQTMYRGSEKPPKHWVL